jgi:hypothetical protein
MKVYLHERAQFLQPLFESVDYQVVIDSAKIDQADTIADIFQAFQRCNESEIKNYLSTFKQVILFNAETPLIIQELAKQFDHSKVVFVTTGHINFKFEQAQVIQFENFFAVMQQHYSDQWLAPELDQLHPYTVKPKYFDALLGLTKKHRSFVHQQITNYNTEYFEFTYNGTKPICLQGEFVLPQHVKLYGAFGFFSQPGNSTSSQDVQYHGNSIRLSHIIPIDIYNITAYSIITETYYSNDFVFLTEKTAKCLLARRLFVMFAGQHYLKHIQNLGFKTFSDVIDESYDQEADRDQRWRMAWQQVERLCSMDQQQILEKIRPILEHNYQHMVNNDWNYVSKLQQTLTK